MPLGYFEQRRTDMLIATWYALVTVGALLGAIAFFR